MANEDAKGIAEELLKLLKAGIKQETDARKSTIEVDEEGRTKADIAAAKEAAAQAELAQNMREVVAVEERLSELRRLSAMQTINQINLDERRTELALADSEELKQALEEEIERLELLIDPSIESQLQSQAAAKDRLTQATRDQTEALDKLREARKKLEQEEYEKGIQDLATKFFPDVMESADNTKKSIERYGKSFKTSGAAMKKMGGVTGKIGAGVEKLGVGMEDFTKSLSGGALIIFAVVKELVLMGNALDSASRKLGGKTGFGNVFSQQLLSIQKAGNMAQIGVSEASSAIEALADGLSSFNPTADATNAHVGLTVARMQKLGVASASSVKSMEHMQRSMGMTATQAADATAQLALMGKSIGVTNTKMINDFNAASGRLAIFGKDNIKMFKQLAAAAKASGIEMQTLIGISKKFDDFSGAADSISQLNAVLGTNLSTMEMMGASDAERVMMIKQQVQMSVGNFDSLDKYTKMYVAQAMGVSDVAEAQKLLNMSQSEYLRNQSKQKEQADIQGKLAENSEAMVDVMGQLKLATSEVFLALSPIISGVAMLLSLLGSLAPIIKMVSKAVVVLGLAWLVLNLQAITFAGVMTALGWTLLVVVITAVAYALSKLYDGFMYLFQVFKKKVNPDFGQIFHFLAEGLTMMLTPLKFVGEGVSKLTGMFGGLFGVAKKDAADAVNSDGFNLKAMASIDTDKLSAGISKIKASLVELGSLEIDGFLAMRSDGVSSSVIMGSEDVITSLKQGKLEVEVKMPKVTMPEVNVKVFIGNKELKDIIKTEVYETLGRAS